MWKYLPEDRRAEYAATDEEADRWVKALSEGRETDARRPPELSTRDNVARAIYTEVKEGRGSPHGGVFLDISYLPADHVRRKLPSMYEQFKELADVDITTGPMEVGPTTHYVMGGIRVDAETGATTVPGLFAAGEVSGGMHGANRLGGNSLSDLLVFGARTGAGAAAHAAARRPSRTSTRSRSRTRRAELDAPLERTRRARTRTRSSATSRRRCSAWSASSGSRPTSTTPSAELAELRARWATVRVDRRPRVQPGLEPRLRAAQPADRLRGDHPQRPAADGEPGRPQPARLPETDDERWGERQQRHRPGRRRLDDRHHDARCRRCPTSCAACSARH